MVKPSHRRNLQVHKITDLKSKIPSPLISIALLS
jgi:hypothetical protein